MGVRAAGQSEPEPPVRTEIQTPLDFNPGQSKIDSDNEDEHDGVRPAPPNADTLCPRYTLPSVSPVSPFNPAHTPSMERPSAIKTQTHKGKA